MKKLPVNLQAIIQNNFVKDIGWMNKLIRLWGTTTINGEEVLLHRREFYNNVNGEWCRARAAPEPVYCTQEDGC